VQELEQRTMREQEQHMWREQWVGQQGKEKEQEGCMKIHRLQEKGKREGSRKDWKMLRKTEKVGAVAVASFGLFSPIALFPISRTG
jgi:hypothetical protein